MADKPVFAVDGLVFAVDGLVFGVDGPRLMKHHTRSTGRSPGRGRLGHGLAEVELHPE